ncbi:MAG: hypothetical protein ACE5HP_01120 [Gemmatimonadota bacterium]
MRLERFRERAAEGWEEIPSELREGVQALAVEDVVKPHPGLKGVHTLGECFTEEWPSQYGGQGETRSRLVLYYGSFQALARLDGSFDWERELWETVLHELLHHREAAAGERGLEEYDWAVEQNQRRHAGQSFDPAFYRAVPPGPDGTVRLESDIFVEARMHRGGEARFGWRGETYGLRLPRDTRSAFVRVRNLAHGRLWVVVRETRPWWKVWGAPHPRAPVEVECRALPAPAD